MFEDFIFWFMHGLTVQNILAAVLLAFSIGALLAAMHFSSKYWEEPKPKKKR